MLKTTLKPSEIQVLEKYESLRAYMQSEWRDYHTEEAIELADKMAEILRYYATPKHFGHWCHYCGKLNTR